jgi:hypothetical protein
MAFDWLSWAPWIIASIVAAVLAFVAFNYVRTRKLPPTDEPVVGDYRIEVDVGTHITSFEGTLYYNNKYLSQRFLYAFAQKLTKQDQVTEDQVNGLKEFLQANAYWYAMRLGTKKLAFISLFHAIETTPFFKTEEKTAKKVVHATGSFNKQEISGFQQVTMEPINLSSYELNPQNYEILDNTGKMVALINEKGPLLQELIAEKEKNRVMQSKVDDLADGVGRLKDEVEYWKHEAKRKGVETAEEEATQIPQIIRRLLPYGILFIIGYVISPATPQLAEYHPALIGGLLAVAGFLIRKVLRK